MRLETERLVVREFVEDDWRAHLAIESIPEVVRYQFQGELTEDEARAHPAKTLAWAREVPRTTFELVVALRGDERMIGRVGFKLHEDPRVGELWFVIAPEHGRNGYATEAARAIITYAFAELGLHRMFGDCDPRNVASARVMEHLGMRREAHFIQNVWCKGEWVDTWIYAVLASEWR